MAFVNGSKTKAVTLCNFLCSNGKVWPIRSVEHKRTRVFDYDRFKKTHKATGNSWSRKAKVAKWHRNRKSLLLTFMDKRAAILDVASMPHETDVERRNTLYCRYPNKNSNLLEGRVDKLFGKEQLNKQSGIMTDDRP
jgi:hypothetical protein